MSPYRTHRGSIVWAAILVLIGVAFLLANLNIEVHPWQLLARYWPALIVLWGLVRLFDYVQARRHPETPAPRFSGADVLLLLLFLILGTVFSRLVREPWSQWRTEWGMHIGPSAWDNPFLHSYTFSRTFSQALPAGAPLTLVNPRGDVAIEGAKSGGVQGAVTDTIRAANEADAKKIDQQVQIQLVDQGGRYALHAGSDALNRGNVRLDWTIRVPAATSTEISTRHGAAQIGGLSGDQKVSIRSGSARISAIQGNVTIQNSDGSLAVTTVKGDVAVAAHGGALQASGVTGRITVTGFIENAHLSGIQQGVEIRSRRTTLSLAKLAGRLDWDRGSIAIAGVQGPLEIETRQKDINISDFTRALHISDRDANIHISSPVPPRDSIEVQLANGDIVMALPPHSHFALEAVSRHGEVSSDFKAPGLVMKQTGDTPSIKGAVGDGAPAIRLMTSYGTIRLVRETKGSPEAKPSGHGIEARQPKVSRGGAIAGGVMPLPIGGWLLRQSAAPAERFPREP